MSSHLTSEPPPVPTANPQPLTSPIPAEVGGSPTNLLSRRCSPAASTLAPPGGLRCEPRATLAGIHELQPLSQCCLAQLCEVHLSFRSASYPHVTITLPLFSTGVASSLLLQLTNWPPVSYFHGAPPVRDILFSVTTLPVDQLFHLNLFQFSRGSSSPSPQKGLGYSTCF